VKVFCGYGGEEVALPEPGKGSRLCLCLGFGFLLSRRKAQL
jgi:hypothetical protein